MIFIGLSGAPSSGKTTLASGLTSILKEQGYVVNFVMEYAREFMSKYGSEYTMADQLHITGEQLAREEKAFTSSADIIITDCPVILGAIYGEFCLDNDEKNFMYYQRILDMSIRSARAYRQNANMELFHIRPRRFVKDGVRTNNGSSSLDIDQRIRAFLQIYGDFIEVSQITVEDRMSFILNHLSENGMIELKHITPEMLEYHSTLSKLDTSATEQGIE